MLRCFAGTFRAISRTMGVCAYLKTITLLRVGICGPGNKSEVCSKPDEIILGLRSRCPVNPLTEGKSKGIADSSSINHRPHVVANKPRMKRQIECRSLRRDAGDF